MGLINQLVQAFLAAHDTRAQVLQSDFFLSEKKKEKETLFLGLYERKIPNTSFMICPLSFGMAVNF